MKKLLFILLVFFSLPSWASSDTISFQGYWLNEKEETIVKIYIHENELKGEIVWMADSLDNNNQPKRDVMNKKNNLRPRMVLGINVFSDFKNNKGVWKDGKVYNYRNGHYYNSKLKIDKDGNLQWTGYYGILVFLSRTKKWTRVLDKEKYRIK